MNVKHVPEKYLLCPDCRGSLKYERQKKLYYCKNCDKQYPIVKGVHVLLPSKIEESEHAENKLWLETTLLPEEFLRRTECNPLFEKLERRLSRMMLSRVSGSFLEVGAGSCHISFKVKREHTSWQVYASDVSVNALWKGKEVGEKLGYKIDYYFACDLQKLPFDANLFDAVFSNAVIHHVPSPIKALQEIRRVLKPKGFYVGMGEIMSSGFFRPVYYAVSGAKARARKHGILERTYRFPEWGSLIKNSGFKDFRIVLYKVTRTSRQRILGRFYYRIIGMMPESLVRRFLYSSINIYAIK